MRPIEQQVILVTGATDGLGRAVAGEIAGQGATLLLHGRSEERGQRTLSDIRARTGNTKLMYYRADFESLSEVRDLAERIQAEHERLDVLLNNAALGIDPVRRVSRDGHEATFQVDYLAPYMLSYLLEPVLITSAPSRIVNVASAGQAPISFDDIMLEQSYDGVQAYCQAKLAEIMLTLDRAAELSGTGVTVNCVHPAFQHANQDRYAHVRAPKRDRRRSAVRPSSHDRSRTGERHRTVLRPNARSSRSASSLRRPRARQATGHRRTAHRRGYLHLERPATAWTQALTGGVSLVAREDERLRVSGGLAGRDDSGLVGHDDGLNTIAEAQLHQDSGDVRLDRSLADDELLGKLSVGQPPARPV